MKKLLFCFAMTLALVLASCGSGGVHVYVSGYNGTNAVYWDNGIQTNLDNGGLVAEANGIVFDSGSIYVVGTCNDATNNKACYWKDGVRTNLEYSGGTDWQTEGHGIAVYNNRVFVSGRVLKNGAVKPSGVYWEDNTASMVELTDALAYGYANSIFVEPYSGSVYVGGGEDFIGTTGMEEGVYWKNDTRNMIAITTMIESTTADSSGNVYSAGYETDVDHTNAVYYFNSTKYALTVPSTTTSSKATGIYLGGSDVYISGYYNAGSGNRPCYWKNGEMVDLSDGSDGYNYNANAIFVKDGSVYVAGSYYNSTTGKNISCYWKDGVKTDLTFGESNTTDATGIYVQ